MFDWLDRTLNRRRGLPPLPTTDIPADLLYDDAPLEVVLYQVQGPCGTPVNVFASVRSRFQGICDAHKQGRTQDVLDLTAALVREGNPVPPDVLIPLIPVLHDLLLQSGQTTEARSVAEQVWRLVKDQDNSLLLVAGITIAFELAAEGKHEESENMWKSITAVLCLRNDEDDGLAIAAHHAVRYWKDGHWKSQPERFSRVTVILESVGVSTGTAHLPPAPFPAGDPPELLEVAAAALRLFYRSPSVRDNPELLHTVQHSAIALAVTEQLAGTGHPVTAYCANMLLRHLQDVGYDKECEELARRALAIRESSLGPGHPQLASSLNNLGLSLVKIGKYAEAEALLRRTTEIRTQMPNPHYWLAQLYCRRREPGDLEKESSAWRRYLELGPPHPERAEEARRRLAELSQ